MIAVGLALGCSDATGPGQTVDVLLTPAAVRHSNPDSVQTKVTVRNGTSSAIRLAFEIAVAQVESSPGVWLAVAGGNDYFNLGGQSSVNDIEPGAQRLLVDGFSLGYAAPDMRHMPVGRYRLAVKYARLNASRSEPEASSYIQAYSNVMEITP